jgi:hypothetical protein
MSDLIADILDEYFSDPDKAYAFALEYEQEFKSPIDSDDLPSITEDARCELYEYGNFSCLVLNDFEADCIQDGILDNWLDDKLAGDGIGGDMAIYFDVDRWKDDTKVDGRGHIIGAYDGEEREQGEYYLYRT